jgi:hypothetical protein
VNHWYAAEILLTAAVLALAMPREDSFVIPERRDWLGWAKRLRPGARLRREEAGAREADQYVTELRADSLLIRVKDLPSTRRRWEPLEPPKRSECRPPWKTAEWAPAPEEPPERRRRAPGDPPTIVFEVVRPAIDSDLGRYLERLPAYPEDDSGDLFFVPRTSLALGPPDHDGAPQHVDDDQPEEGDLSPLQGRAGDAEVDVQAGGEQGPGD